MSESLFELAKAKADYIIKNQEALLEAWVAQHGWLPDECVLVIREERTSDFTTHMRCWVERKGTHADRG